MRTLVVASSNKKKKKELINLLKGLELNVQSIDDVDINVPDIIEDGKTFKQNAIKKAVTVSKIIKGFVIADDSGLMTDCLGGRPGIRSARFARAKATDIENNKKLLRLMAKAPEKKRSATFVSTVALAENGHLIRCVEGTCKGRIGFKPIGHNGFGYDSLFTPRGYRLTFAQMKPDFKNRISHRSKALKKARKVIAGFIRRGL
ncbi:MAG: RdgB/HAM1 family non-canonical purine NTP pyrophosphatase [Candidatus Omnitrophica bacterium]|nr:RdgB/HAM1 family non-canonical purine NTP pyrophosphatase [Candidatus Omnitrophota bacterium]